MQHPGNFGDLWGDMAAQGLFWNMKIQEENVPSFSPNEDFVISAYVQLHKTNVRTKKTPGQLCETT